MTAKNPSYQPIPQNAIAFRPEFLDFERGIRVGNLEDNERITRILKIGLEHRFRQSFVTERWGRGVFWQWIGYLPRANRAAKPLSSAVSFGCSKYYISVDTQNKRFECGMQVERGYVKTPADFPRCELQSDWDWHRLIRALKQGGAMENELRRLVGREEFMLRCGNWDTSSEFTKSSLPDAQKLRRMLSAAEKTQWAGFQLFYPMAEDEVSSVTGLDLVESMFAIFDEVTPAMNLCMQTVLDTNQPLTPNP